MDIAFPEYSPGNSSSNAYKTHISNSDNYHSIIEDASFMVRTHHHILAHPYLVPRLCEHTSINKSTSNSFFNYGGHVLCGYDASLAGNLLKS